MEGLFVSGFLVYFSLLIGALSGSKECLISLILSIILPLINITIFRYYRKNKLTLLSNLLKNNLLISEFISTHDAFYFRDNIKTRIIFIDYDHDCHRWLNNDEKDFECRQFLIIK